MVLLILKVERVVDEFIIELVTGQVFEHEGDSWRGGGFGDFTSGTSLQGLGERTFYDGEWMGRI